MVSTPEQETLQERALKLQTTIKGTFPLFTLTLRRTHLMEAPPNNISYIFGMCIVVPHPPPVSIKFTPFGQNLATLSPI